MEKKLIYIFLDIDGVMTSEDYFDECYERHHVNGIMSMNCFPLDPKCLNNLMILVQALQENDYIVNIILSSTWRLSQVDTQIVRHRLAEYGLSLKDRTTYIGQRGEEIKHYMEQHVKPHDFIIIDDDSFDIVGLYPNNLIQTKFKTGFDKLALLEALRFFNLEQYLK